MVLIRTMNPLFRSVRGGVVLCALLAAVWSFAGARPSGDGQRLPVVTSSTVLADLVRNVGGDRVQVRPLAPAGTDPHTFRPTPETMKALSQARAIFFNGSGLEEWWDTTLKSVRRPEVPVVELSEGLATLKLPAESHGRHRHGEEADPHAWLDAVLVKTYVDRIRGTLATLDTANASVYTERATAYSVQLDELDAWIRGQIEQIPTDRRKLVTFHDAFRYFGKRYGLAIKGHVVSSPGKEPSAKALAELVRRIKQEKVPAVFAEADFNAKVLEAIGKDAGVKVVTNLYDGSLTDGPPADTYINLMRHNVTTIVNALK
jgi:ABC-type Zn uptake system ZnuABC Zn-binding protein ZnuA